jgi:carbamoyl-phosphate synthase large subunit
VALGFKLVATKGTAAAIAAAGMPCEVVNKVKNGRPHIVDMIKKMRLPTRARSAPRRLLARVTTYTTIAGAEAAVEGMKYLDQLDVISVQECMRNWPKLA